MEMAMISRVARRVEAELKVKSRGDRDKLDRVEEEGEPLRSNGHVKTVKRMWELSSVPIVSHHWFFVMTVQLCFIGEQQDEITN